MHKNGNCGPIADTKWHYLGPDNEKYGPYMSKDMMFWLQAGYFNDSLQLRTENEPNYHTLGEWTQLLGTHPFNVPVHSLEATAAQMNSVRSHGTMMMMPPGLQNQFPPQMPMRFPPFLPMPILHQMNQNGQQQMNAQLHSQPPSEPIDASSLSHTPDSDNDGHGRKPLPYQHLLPHHMPHLSPQMQHAYVATEEIVTKNAACQTDPVELSRDQATRLLTELLGQLVIIN